MTTSIKIFKAANVRKLHSVFYDVSESLAEIDNLSYVKIYNEKIQASNSISENGKKQPITKIGQEGIVGVELLVDVEMRVIQFSSITSSLKGCGEKIVKAVVYSAPLDWKIVVIMDWSGGFWNAMCKKYNRLSVF
jgi:hypothetical protein